MLHSDFKDNFIRIHLLFHAEENHGIEVDTMSKEIESHGYQTTPSKIKKELEHLRKEDFLTFKNDIYHISDKGHRELAEAKEKVKILHQEINHSSQEKSIIHRKDE